MSKIIEALERVRAFSAKTAKTEAPSQPQARERVPSAYEAAQRELADVYFAGSTGKARPLPNPTLIRVVDRPKSYLGPWAVTLGLFMVATLVLLLNKRILIDIDVHGAAPKSASSYAAAPLHEIALHPQNFTLSPGLSLKSARTPQELVLANSPFSGPVYASYTFRAPLNAADYVLEFEAKGEKGKESLEVILTDESRRSSLSQRPLIPFPMGLGPEWQTAEIAVSRSEAFDAQRVSQLRFEIGSQRTGNPSDGIVHLRGIRWKPRLNRQKEGSIDHRRI